MLPKKLSLLLVVLSLFLLTACGSGGVDEKAEAELYRELMEPLDFKTQRLYDNLLETIVNTSKLSPTEVQGNAGAIFRNAIDFQTQVIELGDAFSMKFEVPKIITFQERKVEIMTDLANIIGEYGEFINDFEFDQAMEMSFPGMHGDLLMYFLSNIVDSVKANRGGFDRGRRTLLAEFILMGV